MNNYDRLTRQVKIYLFGWFFLTGTIIALEWWAGTEVLSIGSQWVVIASGVTVLVMAWLASQLAANFVLEPTKYLYQAILHVSPEHVGTPAPDIDKSKVGRELVTSLVFQVYQFASSASTQSKAGTNTDTVSQGITQHLPLPLLAIGKDQNIVFVSELLASYLGKAASELIGQNVYSVLNLSFPTEDTLDNWLADCRQNKVKDSKAWDHVHLARDSSNEPLQFDLAAYYSKDNPSGVEAVLALFDHTSKYADEDKQISFVALAVHELRTPLTMLRGYIEVFEEEFEGKLDEELAGFMHKMQAASQQLASFVNNILNVARIESDQLTLTLGEAKWDEIVNGVVSDVGLRAQVRKKTIEVHIAPDLPTVGVDRVSIYEVLANLIDNAVKYSGDDPKKIIITSVQTKDGMVETTVQDFGVGIDSSVVPNLFERFYRNHRTMSQIGGTGLGLFLSKSIVEAHGGHIWVRSKEGEGSTFGFTIKPYAQLAAELKNSDNKEIVRNAHGWIKNHSLYRR